MKRTHVAGPSGWTVSGLLISIAALLLPEPRQLGALAGLAVTAAGLTMFANLREHDAARGSGELDRSGPDAAAVRALLDADAITMHFQPIVWLPTREVVGYEALARFPIPPPRPDLWFELAARCGLRVELELAAVR